MAEIFDFYVADNRTIKFNPIEPILQEDNGVAVWRFRIPKVLNNIDMSGFAWWFVYVNAAKQKYSEPLTLTADTDDPDNYCIADYTIDYGISLTPGSFTFALEAINANGSGDIIEEWHTKTYSHSVIGTLQGNQAEYSETESDIISALIVQIQQKYNSLVGGATPIPVASVSQMTDTSKIYLLTTDNNWYYYNGTAWVSGGQYASGIVIDPTLTQSGQAADAKVVGDEIGELKSAFSYVSYRKNLIGNEANVYYPIIPLKSGEALTISTSNGEAADQTYVFSFYSENKTLLAQSRFETTDGAYKVYDTAKTWGVIIGTCYISINKQGTVPFQAELGRAATTYEPYFPNGLYVKQEVDALKANQNTLQSDLNATDAIAKKTKDDFAYVSYGKNLIGNEANVYYPIIPLKSGEALTISTSNGEAADQTYVFSFYSENKTLLAQSQFKTTDGAARTYDTSATWRNLVGTSFITISETGTVPFQAELGRYATTYEVYKPNGLVYKDKVDSLESTVDRLNEEVNTEQLERAKADNYRVKIPLDGNNQPTYGSPGQVLRTNGVDGTTWVTVGTPTDAQTEAAISDWLDNHPEATTTVQDGSITEEKIGSVFAEKIINYYATPEMFGAVGNALNADGTYNNNPTDDTLAVQAALDSGFPVVCTKPYYITSTLYIENSIEMYDDSLFVFGSPLEYGVIICGRIIGNENTIKQRLRRRYKINVDSHGIVHTGITCGRVKNSILILNVANSKNIGIEADYGVGMNNENEYTCHVFGLSDGSSEVGVLVNNYDSIFTSINTFNTKYGVKVDHGMLDVTELHSWLRSTDESMENYWEDSAVLYVETGFSANVGFLYQDTVRYGILVNTAAYVHVNKYLENNSQYQGQLSPKNVKLINDVGAYSAITADMFSKEGTPNAYMKFAGVSRYAQYGCYMACSKGNDMSNAILDFSDLDYAPTVGNFYVHHDVTHLPEAVDHVVKSEIVGTLVVQTAYKVSGVAAVKTRSRSLNGSTWSSWI